MFCILFHFDKEGITFFHLPLHSPNTLPLLEPLFDIKKCHVILDDSNHPLPFHFPPSHFLSQCKDACSVQVLPNAIHIPLTPCDTDVREGVSELRRDKFGLDWIQRSCICLLCPVDSQLGGLDRQSVLGVVQQVDSTQQTQITFHVRDNHFGRLRQGLRRSIILTDHLLDLTQQSLDIFQKDGGGRKGFNDLD
jgi:hypothetical protein